MSIPSYFLMLRNSTLAFPSRSFHALSEMNAVVLGSNPGRGIMIKIKSLNLVCRGYPRAGSVPEMTLLCLVGR